jgi:hypothetical protein
MLAQAEAMEAARQESTNLREKFAAGVEFAITLKKKTSEFPRRDGRVISH